MWHLNPGLSNWRRKWQLTPVLLPWKSHGLRSLVGYSLWDHKESDMTERLHFFLSNSALWYFHLTSLHTMSSRPQGSASTSESMWVCKWVVRGRWVGSWYSRFCFNQFSFYLFYRLGYAGGEKFCAVPDLENLWLLGTRMGRRSSERA